ncbi:thiamine biosynthesis protein ThiS [Frankia sp. CcI156]|jgi:sulfur carrier protein|uniref:Thiamine biosynthesis protein ThiS n=1 Tax=Frankia casuarinae (strain DSM 45818 / CECT 9043 / HFP020203 / CcI3) TaxID=106370 RepID=Q2J8G4_FRACC|nr:MULTISPECIES: sulfur carrier protein ThiS [Frankia]ABD12428.1 thiamine biosynthesis protein ThiS [Frankia casuarinae]ETA01488.1 sulfur transfer protein involved in thiamine biosynthesis [Frankia sp. CcI6]EYT91994.1 sulfur transfer protein involved in thiamine biosynthesis [Frankia casuarinae]KDA44751.1 sulfur transfer protein involved in thiamine biosynthesis [Frankia sp. BMG5.23]KEZ36599.1 thiamine biosynthesis protein ThiS [Frankia sp. CeD]
MVDRPPHLHPRAHPEPLARARVVVNGAPRGIPGGQPLPDLLAELGLPSGSVVVEHNGVALTPSEIPAVRLADGDILEIVRAVAGG